MECSRLNAKKMISYLCSKTSIHAENTKVACFVSLSENDHCVIKHNTNGQLIHY